MTTTKPRRSPAWSRALDAVAQVPATASEVAVRNVSIGGRRTSVRLDVTTLRGLYQIMQREAVTLHELCTLIADAKPRRFPLTAAIRCYVVGYFIEAARARGKATVRRFSIKAPSTLTPLA
jgi:predicted DNA-binding ribbon-helix-helix protein